VLVTDVAGRVIVERRRPIAAGQLSRARVLKALVDLIATSLDEAEAAGIEVVSQITVAAPGVVDTDHGELVFAPNLQWPRTPLAASIAAGLNRGIPVVIHNESNLAVTAEVRHGLGLSRGVVVAVFAEVGVGGGITIDGHVLTGLHGYAGEIGHVTVERDGLLCGCGGRGCWETVVGLGALLRVAMPDEAAERLADRSRSPYDHATDVALAVRAGDAKARAAADSVGHWLGVGIANLVNVLDPARVVLGGIYATLADELLPPLMAAYRAQALRADHVDRTIEFSALGPGAVVRGGAILGRDRIIADPLAVPLRPNLEGDRHD
jgi:predicted NBD/HSP70 family sugar kinase